MHLATYSAADAGRLIAHYDRSIGARDHIDPDGRVYNAAPFLEGPRARYERLVDGLHIGPKTKPLADMVITMPKGYEGDQTAFFRAAYDSLEERVGRRRVVSAYVHLDEPGARPHMHFAFVPVVETAVMTNDKTQPLLWTAEDQRKNPEHRAGTQKVDTKGTPRWKRVPSLDADGNPVIRRTATASKLFSNTAMRQLHPWMESQLCERLGVERVGLLLDDDDLAKELSGLAHDDFARVTAARDKAVETTAAKQAEAVALDAEITASIRRLEEHRRGEERAARELAELEQAARPSIGDGLSAQAANRGLERQEEQLRSEVGELEHAVEQARREHERAKQDHERARAGRDRAGERYDRARGAFYDTLTRVVEHLRELPRRVFEQLGHAAQAVVEDAGVPVERDYRAMSLAERLAGARASADALNAQRQRQEKTKGGDAR